LRSSDVPERFRELITFQLNGNSCIIDPRGEVIAGLATSGEEEIIVAAGCSMEAVMAAKVACDAAGHYGRPDVFQLFVGGRQIYPKNSPGCEERQVRDDTPAPVHNC
jgi:nitrilase